MRPENFIINSDYASLGNDAVGTVSVTVPSAVAVPGSSFVTFSSVVNIGTVGAVEIGKISSSKLGLDFPVPIIEIGRTGSQGPYSVRAWIGRTSPTEVTLTAGIWNPTSLAMTGEAGAETFTVALRTFIPPFV